MSRPDSINFVRLKDLTKKSMQRIAIGYFVVLIGTEYGFCPSLILLIGILVFPSAFIFGFRPAWQYCIFFALIFGSGNFVTEFYKTTKEKKK